MTHSFRWASLLTAIGGLGLVAQVVVKQQGYVPFSDSPIRYRSEALDDPIARLEKQLECGKVRLEYDVEHGYLPAVLNALKIPISSQTLVFSKTSFQYPFITPEKPRALYFNDDIYVGQVQQGNLLEFVSFDPMQGAIFYVMDERKSKEPRFERAMVDCVQCHVGPSTRGIPGVMLRSVYTRPSGAQAGGTPSFITGQESSFKDRWGGWYVTGVSETPGHLGNGLLPPGTKPEEYDRERQARLTDLKAVLDTSRYVTGTSDVIAHLVLAHQTQMHNLITQTNYQTRLALDAKANRGLPDDAVQARIERPAEQLVRYLLFANEAPFEGSVQKDSAFAREFAARGPRDSKGRSLRDFDLQRRVFKYPCSYLIYSEAFDAIPEPAKSFVYRRLFEVLTGADRSPDFAAVSDAERQAVFEILVDTKPNVPAEWRQYAKVRRP